MLDLDSKIEASGPALSITAHWPRIKAWSLRLFEFGMVQGLVQLLAAVSGFLIVRTMSKPEYALFAIANSMQTACNILADLGIGIGVRSIGGRVCENPNRFGQLLMTALALRRRFAFFSMSICLPITAWMLWRNGGGILNTIGLSAIVGIGVFPLLASSVYGTSPLLHGEYRRMQKLDLGSAVFRTSAISMLAISKINALFAAAVGVATNWIQAVYYRRWAHDHANLTASTNADDRRELIKLSMQSLPNTLFFCFQGQVTILILSFFGNRTGIADITAIGRIAALLAIFSVIFNNVLAPRFTRCQDVVRLPRLYAVLILGTAAALAPLMLAAYFFPGVLLWLLGNKYSGLQSECVWVVAAACMSQLAGVMWVLNSSKAWIRVQAIGYIPIILTVQAVAACLLNLRNFHEILIFNLVAAAAPIPMFLLDTYFGMRAIKSSPKT